MQGYQRKRLNGKQTVPELSGNSGSPLPRVWRRVKRCDGACIGGSGDKVTEWYGSSAAMLDEYPLSDDAERVRSWHLMLPEPLKFTTMRPLLQKLDSHPAHSFQCG